MFRLVRAQDKEYTKKDIEEAYKKITNVFTSLFDMIQASEMPLQRDDIVREMRDMFYSLTSVMPDDEESANKTRHTLDDIVDEVILAARAYDNVEIDREAAMQEAREMKAVFESGDPVFTEWTVQLKSKAPNLYERELTKVSCNEIESQFQKLSKMMIAVYFNEPKPEVEQVAGLGR